MIYNIAVETGRPSFVDLTEEIIRAVARSGVVDGLCVVAVDKPTAAVVLVEAGNSNAQADILNELRTAVPPRVDYPSGSEPWLASARTKAALLGGSKEIPIVEGRPQLTPGCGLCLVDLLGSSTVAVSITCL
ncbi:MAG TPA: hypothetical protein GX393_08590 [Firmicutes bacterium]|jgi:secondary thiamine-phosphate synthase enzyme|nr:hypothetical protein [Bacillota bacterium]